MKRNFTHLLVFCICAIQTAAICSSLPQARSRALQLQDSVKTVTPKARLKGIEKLIVNEHPEHFKYNATIPAFDFKVTRLTKGVFSINFTNESQRKVDIKIYDIIGNLILSEEIADQGPVSKEYNLSQLKMDYFIIEVGNARYNAAKKVTAS